MTTTVLSIIGLLALSLVIAIRACIKYKNDLDVAVSDKQRLQNEVLEAKRRDRFNESTIKDLYDKMANSLNTISNLVHTEHDLNDALSELHKTQELYTQLQTSYRDTVDFQNQAIQDLSDELESTCQKRGELSTKCMSLEYELRDCLRHRLILLLKIKEQEQKLAAANSEEVKRVEANYAAVIDKLKTELESAEAIKSVALNSRAEIIKQLDKLNSDNSSLRSRVGELLDEIKTIKDSAECQSAKDIAAVESELKTARFNCERANDKIKELTAENKALKAQVKATTNESSWAGRNISDIISSKVNDLIGDGLTSGLNKAINKVCSEVDLGDKLTKSEAKILAACRVGLGIQGIEAWADSLAKDEKGKKVVGTITNLVKKELHGLVNLPDNFIVETVDSSLISSDNLDKFHYSDDWCYFYIKISNQVFMVKTKDRVAFTDVLHRMNEKDTIIFPMTTNDAKQFKILSRVSD